MSRRLFLVFFAAVVAVTPLVSQKKIAAPVERGGFSRMTSYDSLQSYLKALASVPGIQLERIALSRQGRNVTAVKISGKPRSGTTRKKLRVLIFAQQHGDEPSGKEALTLLLADIASGHRSRWIETMDMVIVPQMNPDGAELRQRRTSDSVDLNRNHLLLTSPETKGLHDLFDRWKPEVTLDIHEYTTGKEWRDSGMSRITDVQLGMLTHPSTPEQIRRLQHEEVFPFIAARMKQKNFHFHEYLVGAPDTRLRHSTTEINDGRQSFGIVNTISFIQEGLKWHGLEDSLRRRAEAQRTSVEALLDYCSAHADALREVVSAERSTLPHAAGMSVVLRMERTTSEAQLTIPVFSLRTKKDTIWTVTPYHSIVQPHLSTVVPAAYVVSHHATPVLDLLKRHHIAMETVTAQKSMMAEVYTLDSIGTEIIEEDPRVKAFGRWNALSVDVQPGDVVVRTGQLQSLLLTVMLEPESVWGVIGYPPFASVLHKKGTYPIMRIR